MTSWLFLAGAILSEVCATLSLKAAATGRHLWDAVVGVGYLAAFSLLAAALRQGLPLGVAYGVWVASGVALTALLSHIVFKEPLTLTMTAGIALIGSGVLLIELGTA